MQQVIGPGLTGAKQPGIDDVQGRHRIVPSGAGRPGRVVVQSEVTPKPDQPRAHTCRIQSSTSAHRSYSHSILPSESVGMVEAGNL